MYNTVEQKRKTLNMQDQISRKHLNSFQTKVKWLIESNGLMTMCSDDDVDCEQITCLLSEKYIEV